MRLVSVAVCLLVAPALFDVAASTDPVNMMMFRNSGDGGKKSGEADSALNPLLVLKPKQAPAPGWQGNGNPYYQQNAPAGSSLYQQPSNPASGYNKQYYEPNRYPNYPADGYGGSQGLPAAGGFETDSNPYQTVYPSDGLLAGGGGGSPGGVNAGNNGGSDYNGQNTNLLIQQLNQLIGANPQQMPQQYNADGSVNPAFVMAYEQLLLQALAEANAKTQTTTTTPPEPSQTQAPGNNANNNNKFRIIPNQWMSGGNNNFPQPVAPEQQQKQVTPSMLVATNAPGEGPVTLSPLTDAEQMRLWAKAPGLQLPMTFALQGVAGPKDSFMPTLPPGDNVVTLQPPKDQQEAHNQQQQETEPETAEPEKQPPTTFKTDGPYPPLILGPPNANNRQPIRCGTKKFFVALAKMPDVACCANKAFNARTHGCLRNEVLNSDQWQKQAAQEPDQETATTPAPSSTNGTTELPIGLPYKPEIIGSPTASGKQAIKCLIRSYYVPLLKLWDIMCCAEIPYNIKESECKTGVIHSKPLPTTTVRPSDARPDGAVRPDVIGAPLGVGAMPVRCNDQSYYMPVGQIVHSWCCGSQIFVDNESKCKNGQVEPLYIITTTTTPRPTPSGVYLPDLAGPVTGEGRQPVRCYNRTFSVIASRLNEVKCCGDKLFSRNEAMCVNARLQPLPPSMNVQITTQKPRLPFGVEEISQQTGTEIEDSYQQPQPEPVLGFSRPVLVGEPSGSRQSVRCIDKTVHVSLVQLQEIGCCGSSVFNLNNANCVQGHVIPIATETATTMAVPILTTPDNEGAEMADPTMVANHAKTISGADDDDDRQQLFITTETPTGLSRQENPTPEIISILPGGRRAINCGGRKFIVPEEKIPEAACCGSIAYNLAQARCVDGEIIKFGSSTTFTPSTHIPFEPMQNPLPHIEHAVPLAPPSNNNNNNNNNNMTMSIVDPAAGLTGLSFGSGSAVELGQTLPDGRRVVKCVNNKFAISEMMISEVACCGDTMFGIFESTCLDGKIIPNFGTVVPTSSPATTTTLAPSTTAEDLPPPLDLTATQAPALSDSHDNTQLELGDILPDGRQIVKCGAKKFMIPTPKVPTAKCCANLAYNTALATCVDGKVMEKPKTTTLKPVLRDDDSTLPDVVSTNEGRMVLQCHDQRTFTLKDLNHPIYCCGESAFDPKRFKCVAGSIVERNLADASGEPNQPEFLTTAAPRSLKVAQHMPQVGESLIDVGEPPVLVPGDFISNEDLKDFFRAHQAQAGEQGVDSENQESDDKMVYSPTNYRARSRLMQQMPNWFQPGMSQLETEPVVVSDPDFEHPLDDLSQLIPGDFMVPQDDNLPIAESPVITADEPMEQEKNTSSSQPLLLSSLAAASGLAKGVFTLRCGENYWQTRGPPVFYVCCGVTMQDLMQACSSNSTPPVLVSYNEDNQPNSLSAIEALVAEDELTDLVLKQQNSQAMKNPGEEGAGRAISLDLMPTDREYSLPFGIGNYFVDHQQRSMPGRDEASSKLGSKKQKASKPITMNFKPRPSSSTKQRLRCPDGKFCCGGTVYRKTEGQLCCLGRYYVSTNKQYACCGQQRYDLSTHECSAESKVFARRH